MARRGRTPRPGSAKGTGPGAWPGREVRRQVCECVEKAGAGVARPINARPSPSAVCLLSHPERKTRAPGSEDGVGRRREKQRRAASRRAAVSHQGPDVARGQLLLKGGRPALRLSCSSRPSAEAAAGPCASCLLCLLNPPCWPARLACFARPSISLGRPPLEKAAPLLRLSPRFFSDTASLALRREKGPRIAIPEKRPPARPRPEPGRRPPRFFSPRLLVRPRPQQQQRRRSLGPRPASGLAGERAVLPRGGLHQSSGRAAVEQRWERARTVEAR